MDLLESRPAVHADDQDDNAFAAPLRPAEAPKILSIVLKVTERCNLACPYCYFFFSGDDTFKEHPPFIEERTIDQSIAFILDAVKRNGITQVRIGLHGGEPLLLKRDRFDAMCAAFRAAIDPVCDLMLILQTNGVLVTPEWIDLFARHQIRVGVSIDGNEAVHNIFRITKKGKGTYAETLRGWKLLNQAVKERKVPSASILCVVSPKQSGAETYKHFVQRLNAAGMNFLLPDITHDSPEANAAFIDACGDFLIDVFRAWAEFGGAAQMGSVRFIDEIVGPLMDDELCRRAATAKNTALNQFVISSNGEISPDDVIRGIAPRFRGLDFHVGTDRADALQKTPVWLELETTRQTLPAACQACIWKNICRGGLHQHRYSQARGFDNPTVYCEALKRLYRYIVNQMVEAGYPMEKIERRLEIDWAAA